MVARLHRRRLLGALALCAAAPTLWLPRRAHARGTTEVREIDSGKRGVTIELGLRHGPFPERGAKYEDDTCVVFVPHHHRLSADRRIDTLVHFHGHNNTARKAVSEMHLREQLADSGQNAILVAPQGPVEARDSSGGKLERDGGFVRFLGEVRRALQLPEVASALGPAAIAAPARIGATSISAHSGGYRVTAACLAHGEWPVNEVYLFDALYGGRATYLEWILAARGQSAARERHKLVAFYTPGGDVDEQCAKLRTELDRAGVAYHHDTDDKDLDRKALTRARVAFIRTSATHDKVMHDGNALQHCLRWSSFRGLRA